MKIKMKTCCICKISKNINDFYNRKRAKDGKTYACKICVNKRNNDWKARNPEYNTMYHRNYIHPDPEREKLQKRNSELKKKYNIGIDTYKNMKLKQNNKCLICNKKSKLVVDHCHKTGKVRGLLCDTCNRGIGFLQENIDNFNNAIKYLKINS